MCNYIIKDIGDYDIYRQYEILQSLKNWEEIILFHSFATKMEELTIEERKVLKEENFEGFCDNTIYFNNIEVNRIETFIFSILDEKNLLYKMDKKLFIKELKTKYFSNIDANIVNKIKNFIFEVVFYSQTPFRKEFVFNRVLFENNSYLNENGMDILNTSNIWYRPENKEEIIYSMEQELDYTGIVIARNKNFKDYSIGFVKVESADNYDLYLFFNHKDAKFTDEIIKKLSEIKIEIIKN